MATVFLAENVKHLGLGTLEHEVLGLDVQVDQPGLVGDAQAGVSAAISLWENDLA